MFDRHANLKYKFGNRHFWAEGYYVTTVGLNEATIKKYIQDQEKADIALDKLSVRELGGSIVFVRKMMRGSANRSFGIEVAQLAGLPKFIITRAKDILKKLESADIAKKEKDISNENYQLSIFTTGKKMEVATILRELDIDSITPRAALDILADLKEKIENE